MLYASIQTALTRDILFNNRKHIQRRALDQTACKALTFAKILGGEAGAQEAFLIRTSFFLTSLRDSWLRHEIRMELICPEVPAVASVFGLESLELLRRAVQSSDVTNARRYASSRHRQIYDTLQPLPSTTSISIMVSSFPSSLFLLPSLLDVPLFCTMSTWCYLQFAP